MLWSKVSDDIGRGNVSQGIEIYRCYSLFFSNKILSQEKHEFGMQLEHKEEIETNLERQFAIRQWKILNAYKWV